MRVKVIGKYPNCEIIYTVGNSYSKTFICNNGLKITYNL
jgi:hypothetical protein